MLQRKATHPSTFNPHASEVPPIVHEVLHSPGQPLDSATRAFMEPRFGHDFSQVRVHTDAKAAQSALAVNALAYALGRDVVFGVGQYAPRTRTGQRLLAHELTHVVQQGGKRFEAGMALQLGSPQDVAEQQAAILAETVAGRGQPQVDIRGDLQGTQFLQREGSNAATQTDTSGSTSPTGCSAWQDPKDLSKVAAEHYLRTEHNIEPKFKEASCGGDVSSGSCHVYFTPGDFLNDVVVYVFLSGGSGVDVQRADLRGPACSYTYECRGKGPPIFTKVYCQEVPSPKTTQIAPRNEGGPVQRTTDHRSQTDVRLAGQTSDGSNSATSFLPTTSQALTGQANSLRMGSLGRAKSQARQLEIACEEQADPMFLTQALPDEVRAVNALAYTVARDVAFGAGHYDPSPREGRKLLVHELAHVRQQGRDAHGSSAPLRILPAGDIDEQQADRLAADITANEHGSRSAAEVPGGQPARLSLQRMATNSAATKPSEPTAPLNLDFDALADQIYKAIAGLGTDEEAVYRALQKLERNPDAIKELKEAYLRRHKLDLVEDIRDDFSGEELEYALQLLNLGKKGSKQRIAPEPEDPKAAARRIREAVEGLGTDEEAVYASLLPFRRDTLKVQRAYQEEFNEDLRDRIENEMSGSELDYALDLLETPFERYVQEASTWLERFPSIGFGLPWNRDDWFDGRFWKREFDAPKKEWKLVLNKGTPHEAIDALFHEQGRWHVDCAVFVEVVQLYALRQSLGAKRFDQRIGNRMELRAHGSAGTRRRTLFKRVSATAPFAAEGADVPKQIASVEDVLADAPIGSRVRWTSQLLFDKANNLFGPEVFTIEQQEWPAWQHENTVKLAPNSYAAHGVGNRVSRADVESKIADITAEVFPDKSKSEIRAGIFISEIEVFERPEVSEQIEPSAADTEKGSRP